jgi:predicted DCC family thiol-disulfide oxidoreductase YuxK
MPNPDENSVTTTVFFDGSCPLCRWEISLYQGAVPRSPIQWVDVSDTRQTAIEGCSCRELMARFHVQTKEGAMLSGAAAFVALWLLYPSWRWLGKLGSLPGMQALLELLYRGFLHLRPGIQWLVRQFATAKR